MQDSDESIVRLLTEIRDVQKEHLAFYREGAQRSLDAQQTTIALQRRGARLYRIALSISTIFFIGLIAYFFHITH